MKVSYSLLSALAAARAFAQPSYEQSSLPDWHPPGPGDARAPCPMLNSLANHGYLPHDGKDITLNITATVLYNVLNIDQGLAEFLFKEALTTNPAPNATTFSLSDLNTHDILEHDASLSRQDFYFGNPQPFNQTIFDQTRSYWKGPIIDVKMAADARQARVNTSNSTNPTFGMSELGTEFSVGETAAYILILGNGTSGTVDKSWVEYLFENERLPLELGWTRRVDATTLPTLEEMMDRLINATDVTTEQAIKMVKRGGRHVGPRHW
ncbi:Chloroperoxidase [Xylariales sp. AK1849]|nr:Chloroperoxidase [Xylariales sp. AK1849]